MTSYPEANGKITWTSLPWQGLLGSCQESWSLTSGRISSDLHSLSLLDDRLHPRTAHTKPAAQERTEDLHILMPTLLGDRLLIIAILTSSVLLRCRISATLTKISQCQRAAVASNYRYNPKWSNRLRKKKNMSMLHWAEWSDEFTYREK